MSNHTLAPAAALSVLLALSLPAAAAEPFHDADIEAGEEMHAELCVGCHADKFGDQDGSTIYLRDDRRITTPSGLEQQITACTTMLNLDLFPEDERNIAGYLNKQYYKFK